MSGLPMSRQKNLEKACTELVARANKKGGKDNITAIVIKVLVP